jgi:receptor expression-enhancing protein 5/6
LLYWLPFYYLGKLIFFIWLAFPETKGAITLYEHVVRPILLANENKIDTALDDVKTSLAEATAKTAAAAK